MYRLLIGKQSATAAPTVLYFGESGADCQKAIDANWEKFPFIEQAEVPVLRRARRSQALITPPSIDTAKPTGAAQAADAPSRKKKEPLAPAAEQPGAGGEGPRLV